MQTRRFQIAVVGLSIAALTVSGLPGCATLKNYSPRSAALACGAGGAALGAAAGAALARSDPLVGALVGAVAGGLLGAGSCYFITAYQNREVRDYQATKRMSDYDPSQGEVVKLTDLSVRPSSVSPGSKMSVNSTYYIMSPEAGQDLPVTETWSVSREEIVNGVPQLQSIGNFSSQKTIKPGTRESSGEIPLQNDAQEGAYVVNLQVTRGPHRDKRSAEFTVTRNLVAANLSGSKAAATEPERYFVATKINGIGSLREGPSRTEEIVATISQGERFEILSTKETGIGRKSATWHKVRLDDGREAWIHSSLGVVQQ